MLRQQKLQPGSQVAFLLTNGVTMVLFLSFWVGSFPYSQRSIKPKPPNFLSKSWSAIPFRLRYLSLDKEHKLCKKWNLGLKNPAGQAKSDVPALTSTKKRHSIYSGLVLLTKQCRTITGAIPTKSPWPEASREESSRKGVTPTLSLSFLFKSLRSNSIYSGLHAIFLQNGEKPIRQTTVVVAGASKIFRRTLLTVYNQKHLPVNTSLPPKGSIHHVFDSLWQSFPIWVSIRFLFLLSLPWDTAVVISNTAAKKNKLL